VAEKGDQRSDLELVAAVKAGDWAAFDVVYFRYRDWAHRLAWRFCGTGGDVDAQDVVQEVFVYLAGKLRADGFELRAGMTTFLYPAVKHTALALKRKRRRAGGAHGGPGGVDDMDLQASVPPAEPGTVRAELAEVLTSLSDAHREVVLMRFVDDMALEEIAEALAIPLGTAKSRLHHALAALREDSRLRRHFEP